MAQDEHGRLELQNAFSGSNSREKSGHYDKLDWSYSVILPEKTKNSHNKMAKIFKYCRTLILF